MGSSLATIARRACNVGASIDADISYDDCMAYILYGDKGSGSAAVELALAEIGAPVELRTTALEADEQRGHGYSALNAQRKLPTLITPGGETLTESAAILIVLADRHPEARLLPPRDVAEGAAALRWLMFVATELYPLIEIIDYPERFLPHTDPSATEREALRRHVRGIWQARWLRLQDAIDGTPWVLASGFSVLDLYVAVVSRWARLADWRRAELRKVEAIAAQVAARPRCKSIWQRHFSES